MTASVGLAGHERFTEDEIQDKLFYQAKTGDKVLLYDPYDKQKLYHRSPIKHRLLGGAAGPGKTLALLMDHMMECYSFTDPLEAAQVHTIIFRRTHPQLADTVITRFKEKFPREVYRSYNETTRIATWHNGATTHFDSMQYEDDVYGKQGQWLKVDYDEMGEFVFKQWAAISAWNRCPVSPHATKGGASNPIGPGAGWIKSLFIDKVPYDEMDENQRAKYKPEDFVYIPCTYLDNPVYANDPSWISGLDNYPAFERDALKFGLWGVAGGYFAGAWDPARNVYEDGTVPIRQWHKRWMGGDWGFENKATCYWCFLDDVGVVRIYREYVTNHEPPEMLAESIIQHSYDDDGSMPKFMHFYYSHDSFHQKSDPNTVAIRMGAKLRASGLPFPTNAGQDKIGREQLFYQLLKNRVIVGEGVHPETGDRYPLKVPALQISSACSRLIKNIPLAPREQGTALNKEKIAEFPGMDMVDGAGHALYGRIGKPTEKPFQVRLAEELQNVPVEGPDRYIKHLALNKKERETNSGVFYLGRRGPKRR